MTRVAPRDHHAAGLRAHHFSSVLSTQHLISLFVHNVRPQYVLDAGTYLRALVRLVVREDQQHSLLRTHSLPPELGVAAFETGIQVNQERKQAYLVRRLFKGAVLVPFEVLAAAISVKRKRSFKPLRRGSRKQPLGQAWIVEDHAVVIADIYTPY